MKLVLCAALLIPATAAAEKSIDDIKAPDKTAPFTSWTAVQQWMPQVGHGSNPRTDFGYGNESGWLVLADELGDRFSELGRASLIDLCFRRAEEGGRSALAWAICGDDVGKLDVKKAAAELTAEGISGASKTEVMKQVVEAFEKAKKIGASVEAAAKSDPGVAAIVKLGADARAEWAAYVGKNKDAYARYLALKDGVRSGKSNNKGFDGCYDATRAPFAKLVKATKFPWDVGGDPMPGYVGYLTKTTDGYITTVAYAACAWSVDKSGESIYVAAANQGGGGARAGARSLTLAKAHEDSFKPKLADRALTLESMRGDWKYGIQMSGVSDRASIMTPSTGVVGGLAKEDDTLSKLTFKGDQVEACLQWVDTKKVASVSPNGTVQYEKQCKKRGMVANQTTAVSVATKYAAGIAPGTSIILVLGFPVTVWKGKQYVSILGVPAK
ncbi:MAG: hypothetical protein ABI867_15065 [Kofleriaceae bacterium]